MIRVLSTLCILMLWLGHRTWLGECRKISHRMEPMAVCVCCCGPKAQSIQFEALLELILDHLLLCAAQCQGNPADLCMTGTWISGSVLCLLLACGSLLCASSFRGHAAAYDLAGPTA